MRQTVRQTVLVLQTQAAEVELAGFFRDRLHAAMKTDSDQPRGKTGSPHRLQGRDVLFRPWPCQQWTHTSPFADALLSSLGDKRPIYGSVPDIVNYWAAEHCLNAAYQSQPGEEAEHRQRKAQHDVSGRHPECAALVQ